ASQSGHGSGGHHKGHSSNGRRGNNQSVTIAQQSNEQSLRQRAVARLKMFNFNLNWDLHMTQCKPCGPKSSGNIITRRLCRNRRGEDNELYRSNSFKFERFERKDPMETGARTMLRKQELGVLWVLGEACYRLAGLTSTPLAFSPGARHQDTPTSTDVFKLGID
uniref:Uncharacterized protein n=1 Tax=Anopheles culicifacies TaxID=139723 RepID=A0A182MUN2_9DIPT